MREVKELIIRYPLNRLLIQRFVLFDRTSGIVQIVPDLWEALRYTDVLAIMKSLDDQLEYYFSR